MQVERFLLTSFSESKGLHFVVSNSVHEYQVQLSHTLNPTTLLGPIPDWTSALLLGCCDSDVGRQGSAGCCPGEYNRAEKSDKTAS